MAGDPVRRSVCLALALAPLAPLAGCAVQGAAWLADPPPDLPRHAELAGTPFFPQTAWYCGPAALATALGAAGLPATPSELEAEVFLPARGGSLQAEMLAGARRHGAVAVRSAGTVESLLRNVAAGDVVVVLLNLGLALVPRWHYAVVVGYDLAARELLMRSGTVAREPIALRTFEHTWARSGHWGFVAVPPGRWPVDAEESTAVDAAIGYERAARPSQALEAYASALQRWPGSLPLAIGLGTSAYAVGDTARALAVFRAAGERHGSGAAWLNAARLLEAEGRGDEALAAARRALADPRWAAQAQAFVDQAAARAGVR